MQSLRVFQAQEPLSREGRGADDEPYVKNIFWLIYSVEKQTVLRFGCHSVSRMLSEIQHEIAIHCLITSNVLIDVTDN